VVIHPNQGELVSCDQDGSVKVWDLAENTCTHELVSRLFPFLPRLLLDDGFVLTLFPNLVVLCLSLSLRYQTQTCRYGL